MMLIYILVVRINKLDALILLKVRKLHEQLFKHNHSLSHWGVLIVIVEILVIFNLELGLVEDSFFKFHISVRVIGVLLFRHFQVVS